MAYLITNGYLWDVKTPWTLETPENSRESLALSCFERKISGCWTHSAFKWHRNEPVLSYSILSWDSLLFSCYQFCHLWWNANLSLQAKVDYGLLSRVTPTRKAKWQNSHSQSFLELLWLTQCGTNVASQFINHSCSHVTFPSSVLQLLPLASLSVQPKTD